MTAHSCDTQDYVPAWDNWERGRADGIGLAIQTIEQVMAHRTISAQQEDVLLEVYDALWAAKDRSLQPVSAQSL